LTGGVLKEIENELGSDFLSSHDKSMSDSEKNGGIGGATMNTSDMIGGKRTSYYVEENERILNLLITNCEPILSEIVSQVNHFNTYNSI
jgi:hypothetical protein